MPAHGFFYLLSVGRSGFGGGPNSSKGVLRPLSPACASTGDQTLELQRDVLRTEDCERIFDGPLGRNGRVPAPV